jgi:hypothetical protein
LLREEIVNPIVQYRQRANDGPDTSARAAVLNEIACGFPRFAALDTVQTDA